MPQETKQKFDGAASLTQGTIVARGVNGCSNEEWLAALEAALDYRGDITITTTSGTVVEGYLFDCRRGDSIESSVVRLMPTQSTSSSGEEKVSIRSSEIVQLAFTGRDTAAGKTWENWVRRYAEKKLKGEAANIEAERLD